MEGGIDKQDPEKKYTFFSARMTKRANLKAWARQPSG